MKDFARSKIALGIFLLTIGAFVYGAYSRVVYKDSFDRIIGYEPELKISYYKGFSHYVELVYFNKHNDYDFFLGVIKRYESSLNSKKCNFKIVNFQGPMCELRSLPFKECSRDKIQRQVTFEIRDWNKGTDICDGGKYIIIRSYSQN